jgi:glycosyltransferase involved in cell wall biosynthesis
MKAEVLGLLPHRGEGIASMKKTGQAQRFMDYFLQSYARQFKSVNYFTYLPEEAVLPSGCVLRAPHFRLRGSLYTAILPFARLRYMRTCDVFRVYQVPGVLPAVVMKLCFNKPFVVTYGYRYDEVARYVGARAEVCWANATTVLALRYADAIIVTTDALAEYVSAKTLPSRVKVIPNGVDTEQFCPRVGSRPADGVATIISVGGLSAVKNHRSLVEAVAQLRSPARLVLVGAGPQREMLVRLAAKLRVVLELPGAIPHGELADWLAQADVFVLPSILEGQPKALMEAMSCGLPCIGTNGTGAESLIENGRNGLLTQPTPAALTDAIQRLIDDRPLASLLGRTARETIVERHDIWSVVSREIALLKDVATHNRPRFYAR